MGLPSTGLGEGTVAITLDLKDEDEQALFAAVV
jgi:hypothetical protein